MPDIGTPPTPLSNATPQNVDETGASGSNSDAARSDHVHALPVALSVPVGCIIAWHKTLTGVPALDATWAECNGQVLSDADSPLNGQTLPNLNGTTDATRIILRGSTTSGGTGGAATVTLTTAELPAHTHNITSVNNNSAAGTSNNVVESGGASNDSLSTGSAGSGSAFSIIPPVMNMVYIIKIKHKV